MKIRVSAEAGGQTGSGECLGRVSVAGLDERGARLEVEDADGRDRRVQQQVHVSDRLARTACHSWPRSWTTSSARVRFADTQKKRRGRFSIDVLPKWSASSLSTRVPEDSATSGSVGLTSEPLRVNARSARWTRSACGRPRAYSAPITAPMLVPPMTSTGTPAVSQPAGRAAGAGPVGEHGLAAQPLGGERACLDGAEPGVAAAARKQRNVALAEAEPAPFGVVGVRAVDDVVVAALDRVQPAGQLVAPGVIRAAPGRAGAKLVVDRVGIQPGGRPGAFELPGERVGDLYRGGWVGAGRGDADRGRSLSSAISPMTAPRPRSCSTRSAASGVVLTLTRSQPLSST